MKATVLLLLLILFGFAPAWGTTWTIGPTDPNGIQGAITGSADGDIILLTNGTYRGPLNTNLDFQAKHIVLQSQSDDPSLCIIDCQNTARAISFDNAREDNLTVVRGLTILDGYAWGSS